MPGKVAQRILDEAKEQAEKLRAEAKARAEKILADAKSETEEICRRADQDAADAAKRRREHLQAQERMRQTKAELTEKGRVLDELFGSALTPDALDAETYRERIKQMLRRAARPGEQEVVVGENEKIIDQTLLNEAASGLDAVQLTLSQQRAPIAGGFILRRGPIEINASSDALARIAREKLEASIANRLFGEEE